MAEALITIIAEGILKKALTIAASEIAIAWGYEEKLTILHRTLEMIRAKLRDAERQKGTEAVMVWLKQLKDVVGEADDMLDEVHYEMLKRQIKKRDRVARKVPSLPSLKKIKFRWKMGHKIENINKLLTEINTQATSLGLQNEQYTAASFDAVHADRLDRESIPHPENFEIVGRDDDQLHIIELLTQSRKEEKLTIVPIVGMGGIGKTTLAKSIYNDKTIEQHFNVRAWLCVSVKVDINTLLAKIYESLTRKKPSSDLRVNLIKDLEDELASKRYLIVLDDVWVEERPYWEDFKSCIQNVNSKNGSGILVTTRKLEIGTQDMVIHSCHLQGLPYDECWSIFRERAFVARKSPSPELEEIGREIVKKCGGLPLLLNVLGGLLANYINDTNKWLSIKESNVWDLKKEKDRVQKSLELSFDNLPSSIAKQCFAYCSIYEKDTLIEREELIQLWMALGLLVQADDIKNVEMEDVGNDIFQILVSNSLLQVVTMDDFGYVSSCKMHDLVHDLSLSLLKEESLSLVHPTDNGVTHIPHVRHLALSGDWDYDKMFMFIKRNKVGRSLHTLFLIDINMDKNLSFQGVRCIRILTLKGYGIEKIDDSIGELVHLRYLDLSDTRIRVLPKAIGKLYHLQTLKLPFSLDTFSEAMINLISLRHVISEKQIPANILRELTSLRTFPPFSVCREQGHRLEVLRHLNNLSGKLCISDLEYASSKEEGEKAELCRKKNLSEIEFNWSNANEKKNQVLEGLQPPADVEILRINSFPGHNFPEWLMKLQINIDGQGALINKLMSITLTNCDIHSLPSFEHLPHLRHLKLTYMYDLRCLRNSSYHDVNGSTKPLSQSLRSLELENMNNLEKWIDGVSNNMNNISPVLERLKIKNCRNIILLDECHPHPLVSLDIYRCRMLYIKSIQGLTSLKYLKIDSCESFYPIPDLPKQPCHSLKTLKITRCENLTSLPCNLYECFPFINKLHLGPFSMALDSFPSLQGIDKLRNHLHSLKLNGLDHWELLPEGIQHLTSLTRLTIFGFGIRELPVWLTNMSFIRRLDFRGCPHLDEETVKRGANASDVNFFNPRPFAFLAPSDTL